jgi:hypothetical protein
MQPSDTLCQKPPVDSGHLGNVGYAFFRQPRLSTPKEHIARSIGESEIGCQNDSEDGLDEAFVETVSLNDHKGTSSPWLRALGLRQRGPPDVSPADYHSSRAREADWSAATTESSDESSSRYISLSLWVTPAS